MNSHLKIKTMRKLFPFLTIILLITACTPKIGNKVETLTGDKIVDNYVNALGGEKKLKEVKTMTMIAVTKIQDIELQIESYRKAPDKMVVKMISPNGTMTRILNGEEAYAISPAGSKQITGIDLAALKEEATIFPELYKEKFGYTREYLGIEKVDEKETHKVKISMPDGKTRTHFFDKETNLLTKMIDESGASSYYGDYKSIEGVMVPHSNKLVGPYSTAEFKIKEIEINPVFEEGMFEFK